MTNYSNSKYIKIIDKVMLSQNKFLLIIEIDNKKLLLGVTENNMSILKELDNLVIENTEIDDQNKSVKFNDILKEVLLKNKITSKFMKGNINYEGDEFIEKKDKK